MQITKKQLEEAFTEWDRLYRESPEKFEDVAVSLLKGTPETYGESSAPFFIFLIKELAKHGSVDLDKYL